MGRVAKQVTIFDEETGKIFRDSTSYGSQNGDKWMIMYRDAIMKMAMEAPLVAWKVFACLAAKQPFEGGVRITKQAVANILEISYENVMRGFKWLKEKEYIKEIKTDGQTEFLLNPKVATCGKNRKAKIDLWESN